MWREVATLRSGDSTAGVLEMVHVLHLGNIDLLVQYNPAN